MKAKRFSTFISLLLLGAITVTAQEINSEPVVKEQSQMKTLFNSATVKRISGFGASYTGFTTINGNMVVTSGGSGGVIINNFFIGGYGEGGAKDRNFVYQGKDATLEFSHGGLIMGYEMNRKNLVHPVVSLRTGWGSANVNERYKSNFWNDENYSWDNTIQTDNVFVLTPSIAAELNVTRFFKINAGVTYRQTFNVDQIEGMNNADFSGLGGNISFVFGWF